MLYKFSLFLFSFEFFYMHLLTPKKYQRKTAVFFLPILLKTLLYVEETLNQPYYAKIRPE